MLADMHYSCSTDDFQIKLTRVQNAKQKLIREQRHHPDVLTICSEPARCINIHMKCQSYLKTHEIQSEKSQKEKESSQENSSVQ